MTSQTVNAALLLEAARMVRPDREWQIGSLNKVFSFDPECPPWADYFELFSGNDLTDSRDAHALMLALMKEENGWWTFGEERWRAGHYEAHAPMQPENIRGESFPHLLLKCASAQTGIDLYSK